MPRPVPKRLRSRLAVIGPGLLALVVAAAGCTDDTPGAGAADLAASRKAAEVRAGGFPELGPTRGDVAPVRTRGKGAPGRPAGPAAKTQGTTR
jgi:hypothetical protein